MFCSTAPPRSRSFAQLSTTDEETLAEELAKPAFATPVAAEEEGGSIFVTDAGTEGDDPSEVIQVNKREKLNMTTWQWFLKVRGRRYLPALTPLCRSFTSSSCKAHAPSCWRCTSPP